MKDYQLRVVEEQKELAVKMEKLNYFIESEAFDKVPKDEQRRLIEQHRAMQLYSDILQERIAHFPI